MRPLKGLIGSWPKSAQLGDFKQIRERNAVNLGAGGGGLPGCRVRCAGCRVRSAACQGAKCGVQGAEWFVQYAVFSV